MERSLLYVSQQSPSMLNQKDAIDDIVAVARLHNGKRGITGALACTKDHFAQFLEGPAAELDDLMTRIERDHRHVDITILQVMPISRRRLPGWSMAYSGPSTYVARQIVQLIGEHTPANPARSDRLIGLLVGLANPVLQERKRPSAWSPASQARPR